MAKWQAKKFQLPNHNFETTAIKFEDGRVGLCYHGSVIWDDEGGGWEEFIAADWNTVWKEGKPCPFHELPLEMRVACPVCGAKLSAGDRECLKCGIVFDKMKKDAVVEAAAAGDSPATGEKSGSKLLNISLMCAALLVAGLFFYYVFKPGPPRPASKPAEQNAGTVQKEMTVGHPEAAPPHSSPAVVSDNSQGESQPSGPEASPVTEEMEQYYAEINLNDLETARHQLQEATKNLNEEAAGIQKAMRSATTQEEKKAAMADKVRYDRKAMALSGLIKEFNARNKNGQ